MMIDSLSYVGLAYTYYTYYAYYTYYKYYSYCTYYTCSLGVGHAS